jgi:hypothetical protein
MATPIWGFYAHHVEPLGPGLLFALVGSLLFADRWFEDRRPGDLAACLLLLALGFLADWPAFYVPCFLGLLCLAGRERPGWRWSLLFWGFALAGGAGMLLWIRHMGEAGGFGLAQLQASALHRAGWMGGFTNDSGLAIGTGQVVAWIGAQHGRMFLLPVSIAGGAAALLLLGRFVLGRDGSREALCLVPLGVGLLHVLIFPQGAYQHEYWQFLLSVGLAIPPFALAAAWTSDRVGKVADLSMLALSLVVLVFGTLRVQAMWRWEDLRLTNEKIIGQVLRDHVAPDEVLLSNGPRSLTFAIVFYADRKHATVHDSGKLAAIVASSEEPIGGLLLLDEEVAAFRETIETLDWGVPLRRIGYTFWDARP